MVLTCEPDLVEVKQFYLITAPSRGAEIVDHQNRESAIGMVSPKGLRQHLGLGEIVARRDRAASHGRSPRAQHATEQIRGGFHGLLNFAIHWS
jgi:hypothetical protein